ncbi:MAG: sulfite exporter TauE/SafE family protein [Gammaproteobacteria bacterium]|nr:sulfite exporter TauE/SafE family protein [Gammaproteobacteria bacterium]
MAELVPFSLVELAAIAAIVLVAYVILGTSGFGSAVVGIPLLAHFMPLRFAVPLVLLLDAVGMLIQGARVRRQINRAELKRLIPFMAVGIVLGTTLLANLPQRALVALLGGVAVGYGLVNLAGRISTQPLSAAWAGPFGVAAGTMGALFGTGGPIYVIYLSRRLPDMTVFRATITAVLMVSVATRVVIFAFPDCFCRTGCCWSPGRCFP